jgi:hypothetical protein
MHRESPRDERLSITGAPVTRGTDMSEGDDLGRIWVAIDALRTSQLDIHQRLIRLEVKMNLLTWFSGIIGTTGMVAISSIVIFVFTGRV